MRSQALRVFGRGTIVLAAAAFAALASPALASPTIVNGTFASSSSGQFGTEGPGLITLAGWNTTGYNFVFQPGVADTTGAPGIDGQVILAAPADSSPAGGNFIGLDATFHQAPVTTTVTGLTPGSNVTISFYYAAAQQTGFLYGSTQGFDVTLGGQTDVTPDLTISQQGFSGWYLDSLTFDPTATSELLSFATDSPSGQPPFTLLADVTISGASSTSPTPEPGSLLLLTTGLLGLAGYLRYHYMNQAKAEQV